MFLASCSLRGDSSVSVCLSRRVTISASRFLFFPGFDSEQKMDWFVSFDPSYYKAAADSLNKCSS